MENNKPMNYYDLAELVSTRMIDYADRVSTLDEDKDQVTRGILMAEIKGLAHALDSDEEILHMVYHRHMSESNGLVFEVEHGDPELQFGWELP